MRGLAAPRYERLHRVLAQLSVMGVSAMSKRQPKARRVLEVTVMFEPTRLSNDHLADAYTQVVPLCTHPIKGTRRVVEGADTAILVSLKRRRRS